MEIPTLLKYPMLLFFMLFFSFIFDSNVWANDQTSTFKEVSIKDHNFSQEHFFDLKENTFDKNGVNFKKGWLGVFMKNKKGEGVRAKIVITGSPAHICGLQDGDLITKINGIELKGDEDSNLIKFKKIVEEAGKGNTVTLTVLRNDIEMEFMPELISKFLDVKDGLEKHHINTVLHKTKERSLNEAGSFLKFILNDEDFKVKFMKTMQRIGEETYSHESYHNVSNTNVFRLSLIDYLMSHPLDVPYYSEIIYDHFTNKSLLPSLASAAELLDLTHYLPPKKEKSNNNYSLQELIENILHTIIKSAELREDSLNKLTQAELKFLHDISHRLHLNSEDLEADIIEKFLETVIKVDLSMLIKSSLMVVGQFPLEHFENINPKTLELRPFNLPNSKILINNSIQSDHGNETQGSTKVEGTGFGGDILFIQEVSGIGKIVVGGPGTTYYYDDAAFIIDVGGNDYYFNNSGASREEGPISICIDLSGNDTYTSSTSYSQGAARFGTGILLDFDGDDRYMGNEYCQGFGLFGIGLLYDENGDDSYNADVLCQGGGLFGIGFLRDKDGNDTYFSRMLSQGIGLTKGVGGLIDSKGNDVYFAGAKYSDHRDPERSFKSLGQGFAIGIRPNNMSAGASGGIGALIDENGNDTYHGDYFAQGSSYYFSLGMLYDKSGHDRYYSGRYSQGAGIHSSIGILKDYDGDDLYNAYFGVSQGCGYDTGIGYLIDLNGNDFYKSNTMSQGVGAEKGYGVLSDFSGNDHYSANDESQGYSYPSKNEAFFGIGILSDIGGDSNVFNKEIKDDTLLYRTNAGILMNKRN